MPERRRSVDRDRVEVLVAVTALHQLGPHVSLRALVEASVGDGMASPPMHDLARVEDRPHQERIAGAGLRVGLTELVVLLELERRARRRGTLDAQRLLLGTQLPSWVQRHVHAVDGAPELRRHAWEEDPIGHHTDAFCHTSTPYHLDNSEQVGVQQWLTAQQSNPIDVVVAAQDAEVAEEDGGVYEALGQSRRRVTAP